MEWNRDSGRTADDVKSQVLILALAAFFALGLSAKPQPALVSLVRVPNAGIQPQVAVDSQRTAHIIYFSGTPSAGDVFYVRSSDGGIAFSSPLRVNTHAGSAIATGNIRGAHVAIGRRGRVHVAWMGSQQAPRGDDGRAPMLYTRLDPAHSRFEIERNVIRSAYGLDGGGSLAADSNGHVYVAWHAPAPRTKGEENRRVWVSRSDNDGESFSPERAATDSGGVCACCGMRALADSDGKLYLFYRSARDVVHRDMQLLVSVDKARTFQHAEIDGWNVGHCVMSTTSAWAGSKVRAAWETRGQIVHGFVDARAVSIASRETAPGESNTRKHPVLAMNSEGNTLLAWTEGMGWNRGGSLAWQLYDPNGRALDSGRAPGVPVWSLIAAFPRPDGGFTILY